ncbi:hypothetical protein BPAE_0256g00040 [Botrytis paeoniae]|uniref:Uncharacterized protein n=1 Tax=Botrytis paeoniae TaxID=278948 RepID=A0A4Z1F8M3_9HELO|nr:hypothetical protein BPAE_0256g00040 [Botrytis paeoniae]
MPKTERHVEWLDNYFNDNNVNGDLDLTSGEIAAICNNELDTEAWTKGPSPKNRRIMTDGVDAQIVGRHMQELKKKAAGKPRATRRTQTAINRIDSVLAQRGRHLWIGDRMLLAMLNQTNPENIKNYVEEKARQEGKRAKEAGGQAFQDWEARKRSRVASNKYANKMWAEYNKPGKKDEYLQKLVNGLISLETGEAIKGNSINHPGSSLNPANGYKKSTSDGDGDDKAVDADASEAIVDDDDYPMGNDIGNESESQTGYKSVADSLEYPDHINDLPQSQTQIEDGDSRKQLDLTHGNIRNAKSQINSDRSYQNAGSHPDAHPVSYNTELNVSNARTNRSEYEASNIQTMIQNNGAMMESVQPRSDDVHSTNMYMGFRPSPQVHSSRYTSEPVRQRQNERSHVVTHEEQDTRASHVGYQVHGNQSRYPDVPQMLPDSLLKRRKEPLVDEELLDVRPSKRQCQPRELFEPERQFEPKQHFPPEHQYNGLHVEESDVEESLEPNLDVETNLNRVVDSMIAEEPKELHERDMRLLAATTVRPRNHRNVDQGREVGFWGIVAHPEGGLRTEHVLSRGSQERGHLGRRSGDKFGNSIIIPEDCEEAGNIEPSQGTSNRISIVGRQSAKKEEQSGHLESVSSPKGYDNIWYSQGRIRTCEEPSKSPWQASHHFDGISTAISMQPTRRRS